MPITRELADVQNFFGVALLPSRAVTRMNRESPGPHRNQRRTGARRGSAPARADQLRPFQRDAGRERLRARTRPASGAHRTRDARVVRHDDRSRARARLPAPCDRPAARGRWPLRVNVFSRALNRDRPIEPVEPTSWSVGTPGIARRRHPLRLKSFRLRARSCADQACRYISTFPLSPAGAAGRLRRCGVRRRRRMHQRRLDLERRLLRRRGVVWPDAPQLTGVSMQLLQAGLARNGVRARRGRLPRTMSPSFAPRSSRIQARRCGRSPASTKSNSRSTPP